ncbi:NAD-dependent epimerase/dehydratase family protein [Cytophaga aurantiaca]|uniref:NAD-dependent epimerase/dehydratase family protein n=1 Tax=Cytophaga aurantiaca TaxID=29530 RepID=UPI000361D9ED|nr:NAD-dependent epimerase/dehydratase family protein [Cytophaga aurantiaca]
MNRKTKIIITGAAGFLGGRLVKQLAASGMYDVIATSRRTERKTELESAGCTFISGDLLNSDFCLQLTKEADIIVHCAALSSVWGSYYDFYDANVITTKNLLAAAIQNGVRKFIFISTPSIYFDFTDKYNISENDVPPEKSVNAYASTKLMAEQFVLEKNSEQIKTVALRPRAIIGAEDTVIFPRIIRAYTEGRLKIIGDGKTLGDLTAVSNVIEAVHCCIRADDSAMGQAYNISDGNPVLLWPTINHILKELGHKPITKKISAGLVLTIASIIEGTAKLFNAKKEPSITKYGIGVLAKSITMDIHKARTALNYKPVQTTEEAINEFITWYRKQK